MKKLTIIALPAWDIVQSQMILGGYRLAAILDELFK